MKIDLPYSKSISNRLLILRHLSGNQFGIQQLSDASDTRQLIALLNQSGNRYDAGDGGTTFRFLLAALAITPGSHILYGTMRLNQRPIHELVEALTVLGADIAYVYHPGRAPLKINGKKLIGGKVEVDASRSSQFVSALILIAPFLENGLVIELKDGKAVSRSYISMSLRVLDACGYRYDYSNTTIIIPPQKIESPDITVERDWSAAAFWYELIALGGLEEVQLCGLKLTGVQGDERAADYFSAIGVETLQRDDSIHLKRKNPSLGTLPLHFEMSDVPDLTPSLLMACFGKRIPSVFTGTHHLKFKESDRVDALVTYMKALGGHVRTGEDHIELIGFPEVLDEISIDPLEDHRLAMAMAMFSATGCNVTIRNAEVVRKSYPLFWEQVLSIGLPLIKT